jgi:hypothetical protein
MNIRIGKITIYGSAKEIEITKAILEKHLPKEQFNENESKARLLIQSLIDDYNVKAAILWDGNRVWSRKRIIKDIRAIIRRGMSALSDYLYEFFHLCCGSIAHYNKQGWICEYPDIETIKGFLLKNEYGQSVLIHQPYWASDRIEILKEVYKMFGLEETP